MGTKTELRNQKRRSVVEAIVIRREPVHLVARIFQVSERTVFDWLSRYRSGGWDALKESPRPGRPRKLLAEHTQWICQALTQGNPRHHQFAFHLWTLKTLRTLIQRELAVTLSGSAVSRLLGRLGLHLPRALYDAYRQDPERVDRYLARNFPKVMEEAHRRGAERHFVDELSVRGTTCLPRVGNTQGTGDVEPAPGTSLITAVTIRGDIRFSVVNERIKSRHFIAFLSELHQDAGRPILVVASNATHHHSKETQSFISQQNGEIQLVFLPAGLQDPEPSGNGREPDSLGMDAASTRPRLRTRS